VSSRPAIAGRGAREDLFERAGLAQLLDRRVERLPAAVHDDHAAADRLDLGQDVRREDHGARLAFARARELADQRADLADLDRVEADGRLVEDHHGRIVHDRLGEADALAVALRQRADHASPHLREAAAFERAVDRGLSLRARHVLQLRDVAEIALDAHFGIERRRLGQVSDRAPRGERVAEDVVARDRRRAVGGRQEARQHAHRGGLAGAVGPEEAHDFAGLHREGDVRDRHQIAVSLGEAARFDHARLRGARPERNSSTTVSTVRSSRS